MSADAITDKLIDAGIILEAEGHSDCTRGHVSARMPDDPNLFLIKSSGIGLEEITPENLTLCNLTGERLSGGPRHSEVFIHSEIYRARPDVQCVIHTHPPHAVALCSSGLGLRPLNQQACTFFEALPTYTDTVDLIRNAELGAGVARALGPHRAVMLQSHGVAVAGGSIDEAVCVAVLLEEACRMMLLTLATGHTVADPPRDQVLAMQKTSIAEKGWRVNFAYLQRKHARAGAGVRK